MGRGGSTAALLIEAGEAWLEEGGRTSRALWGGSRVAAGEQLATADAIDGEAIAAYGAALATAALAPKLGRARPHGVRSLGHPDPGAISIAYCLIAATRPRH